MSGRIFLSYAREDQALVEWEANTLLIAGSEVFLDTKSLRHGSDWPVELMAQVRSAKRFLLFWSSHAMRSEWVRHEYEEALRVRSARGDDEFLQILKLDEAPLPMALASVHYLDRSREELLIIASETKKAAWLDGGLRELFASSVVKIEKATPRTTRIMIDEASALPSGGAAEVRWSLKRADRSKGLPSNLKLSAFKWIDRRHSLSRLVIFVPGFLGSQLASEGDVIWMDILKLVRGGMERLRIDRDRVEAVGVIQSYRTFCEQAGATTTVIPCPYDWRLSFADASRALASVMRQVFASSEETRPTLVTHGTGSFLVRALAAFHPEVWAECQAREVGVVFAGASDNGTYRAAEILTRSSALVGKIGLIDLRHSRREIEDIFSGYPGLLELLPRGDEQDLLDERFWAGTPFQVDPARLAKARRVRDAMASSLDSTEIRYVLGSAKETIAHISIEGSLVRKRLSAHGDGYSPFDLAFPGSTPKHLYFADGLSADMLGNPAVIRAVLDLAMHGYTTVLSQRLADVEWNPQAH